MLSDLFRVELIHPFVVHFPIALLINAGLVRALQFIFRKRSWRNYLTPVYFWCLVSGIAGLFLAYLSGEQAETQVERLICDPLVIEVHEDFAKLTILFSCVTLIFSVIVALTGREPKAESNSSRLSSQIRREKLLYAFRGIEFFSLACALGALIYSSHRGASLVYEQGAGFHRSPVKTCKDTVETIDNHPEHTEPINPEDNTLK
jgi:hypothetical protein